jgi:hypothetical protein
MAGRIALGILGLFMIGLGVTSLILPIEWRDTVY